MTTMLTTIDTESAELSEAASSGAWSDWLGMVASIGCAIHCAAMPFVIAYLPALGLSFLADEAFHKWMAVACFIIALTAFIPGLRTHRRFTPVIIASVGLVMISVAAFGFAGQCCPSCAATAAPDSASGGVESTNLVALSTSADSDEAAVCTDASCPHCASKDSDTIPSGSEADASDLAVSTPSPLVGRVVPWLTPIGGIILVSAHLLNRRYGCLCGCCSNDSSEGAAA